MSWRSLQWLFSFVWLGTGFLCCLLLVWATQSEEEALVVSSIKQKIQQRNLLMLGLGNQDDALGAATGRLNAVEQIARPYLLELSRQFSNGDGREWLSHHPIPLREYSTLMIFRGGKVLYLSEDYFQTYLGRTWAKKLASGLSELASEEMAALALSRIYSYPMSREDFQVTTTKFQQIYARGRTLHRWYDERSGYQILWLVDLDNLPTHILRRRLHHYFAQVVGGSLWQGPDTLVLGNHQEVLTEGNHGIGLWIAPGLPGSLLRFGHLWPIWGFWMLIWIYLLYNGGVRLLATRARLRLAIITLFALSIVLAIFWNLKSQTLFREMELQRLKLEEGNIKLQDKLNAGFRQFAEAEGRRILNAFRQGKLNDLKLWEEGYYYAVAQEDPPLIYTSANKEFGGESPRWIVVAAKDILTEILTAHFLGPGATREEAEAIWQLDEKMKGQHDTVSDVVRSKTSIYRDQDLNRFVFYPVMSGGFFGQWSMTGQSPDRQAILVAISSLHLMETFFRTAVNPILEDHQALWVASNHRYEGRYELGKLWNPELEGDLLLQETRQQGGMFLYRDSVAVAPMPTSLFPGWTIVSLQSTDEMDQRIQKLSWGFLLALLVTLGITALVLFFIVRRIEKISNSLKEGFREFDRGKTGQQLISRGWDEGSKAIQAFNSFLKEAATMQRMLPFVSKPMLDLLSEGEEALKQEHEAVVLFSDIRAFTTISENWSPEEVVEMLNDYFEIWQRHAEKFGGVVERFIGDAIRIVFFENRSSHYLQDAIEAAIAVRRELPALNQVREAQGQFTIQNGVGLCRGKVRILLVGDDSKLEFLAQGYAVHRSEELEAMSKEGRGTQILLDDSLASEMKPFYSLIDGPGKGCSEILRF